MLSTVAERIYWTARYLERVENTARLVNVYANLLFDLPRAVNIGWYSLVELNSGVTYFEERYKNKDERNVIKFVLADLTNPGSMMSSLHQVRENIRTSRDVVPIETWELVNELKMFAEENIQSGINRGQRHEFLESIIKGVQQINGLLGSTMSQDAAWQFLRVGRNLERADMTTRILDAGAAFLLNVEDDKTANLAQIVWGNVLSSVSAYVPYRRTMHTAVKGGEVAEFLLEDKYFPRTVRFCLDHMDDAVGEIPNSAAVQKSIRSVRKKAFDQVDYEKLDQHFRDYLNDLQLDIASLHTSIVENWFSLE